MLKQASIPQFRRGEISRKDGWIAITMRFYPRGLRRESRDEYLRITAPDEKLFKDWLKASRIHGHDQAFAIVDYENRFELGEEALAHLESLAEASRGKDVYLVCQCPIGNRCHREILLLLARERFGARIAPVYHSYSKALRRLIGSRRISRR